MKKYDLGWVLWGILIAFGLQVFYDGIGDFPNCSQKFWGGLIIEAVSFSLLFLYASIIKKDNQESTTQNETEKKDNLEMNEREFQIEMLRIELKNQNVTQFITVFFSVILAILATLLTVNFSGIIPQTAINSYSNIVIFFVVYVAAVIVFIFIMIKIVLKNDLKKLTDRSVKKT